MSAYKREIIAQGQQLALDRRDQRRVVAVRKIRPSHRSLKQHIPHLREPCRLVDEHDMSGGVPGAMQHLEHMRPYRDRLALGQVSVRRAVAEPAQPIHLALPRQVLQQHLVAPVRPDHLYAQAGRQFGRTTGMIQMPMRQPDRCSRQTASGQRAHNPVYIPARIDNDRLQAVRVPDQRAILFERGHRNNRYLQAAHCIPIKESRHPFSGKKEPKTIVHGARVKTRHDARHSERDKRFLLLFLRKKAFLTYTAFLRFGLALNRTVLPAFTFTGSPVRGFIALRALVLRTVNVPKDGSVKPPSFFSCLTMASISVPAAALAATPVQSVLCWMMPQ